MLSTPRRAFLVGAAAAATACATPAAPTEPDLDTVLRNHARARGGTAELESLTTMLSEAVIIEPSFTVTGRYIAAANGRMRVDVFHEGNRGFSEGIDENGAWTWPGGQPSPSPASVVAGATLARGVEFNLHGLHVYPARGHAVTLLGRRTIAGVAYYELHLRLRDGYETFRYVNPETWLIDRYRDTRALHPDVDPTEVLIETENSDFRRVGGVVTHFAWTERNVSDGATLQQGEVQRLEYNVRHGLNFSRSEAVIAPAN
jgi:hypothetical protein